MYFFLLFILSIMPGILLLWYFYEKDVLEKEPRALVLYAFLLGIFAVIPAIIFEFLLGSAAKEETAVSVGTSLYEAFIVVAVVEEGIKYLLVRFWALRQKEFTELYDGILYATAISLGFATLENILYVLQGGIGIALIRAFFTVPMHAFGSVIIGYYLAKQKFNLKQERFIFFKALLLPIILHGAFNFSLVSGEPELILLVFPIMGIYLLMLRKIFKQLRVERQTTASLKPSMRDISVPTKKEIHELGEPSQSRQANNLFWMIFFVIAFGIAASIIGVFITTFLD